MPHFLRQHPNAVVLFHASWCSHCKQLLPTYASVATTPPPGVAIAALQCDDAHEVIEQYDLEGFPTILRFRGGRKVEQYHGDRTLSDLQQFCAQK